MEVLSGAVLKSIHCCYSGTGNDTHIGNSISGVCFRRFSGFKELKSPGMLGFQSWGCGFEDKGHLDYYRVSPVCGERKGKKGWNRMSTKKRMKLLKGLANDLAAFEDLGFGLGLDSYEGSVAGDEKGKTFSQATEILLAQLKQLRAEEEKMKEEIQEKKKTLLQDSESSSSESSESSDSECDAVVDMNRFKDSMIQPVKTMDMHLVTEPLSLPTPSSPKPEQDSCNVILEATLNEMATIEALNLGTPDHKQSNPGSISSSMMAPLREKRIEVCMGGKCKKSGAPALMGEFQRVVGDEGAVVGCKCMGKCKSGPNVRVLNGEEVDDDSRRTPSNHLCIGVGLEDVGLIVANYFADDKKGLGLAAAAVHS